MTGLTRANTASGFASRYILTIPLSSAAAERRSAAALPFKLHGFHMHDVIHAACLQEFPG